MKKTVLMFVSLLSVVTLGAQEIRTNYRSGGMTHISTEYEALKVGNNQAWTRVELVGFPDGSTLYLLYMNLEQKTSLNVPKSVKMAVNLANGKFVRLEQIGTDSATKKRLENGMFWNRTTYAVETPDMEKMLRGVKSLDIVTGWNPDDYIQATFTGNEFSDLLERHCLAIKEAADKTVEQTVTLAAYSDNVNSIISTSNPVVAHGDKYIYNVILTHIYYKNTNGEDIDLAFMLGTDDKYHFPMDSEVKFFLADGTTLALPQTRDEQNFIYVFPSIEELHRLAGGIKSIALTHDDGVFTDTFSASTEEAPDLSAAINLQLQLLLSLSPR